MSDFRAVFYSDRGAEDYITQIVVVFQLSTYKKRKGVA
jgi:hypothetical protein